MKHLACIMDGNRRWAKQRMLQPWLGHQEGVRTVKTVIQFCLDHAIKHVSLYTFSLENFNRSPEECHYLFNLISDNALNYLDEFAHNDVRIRFIGERSLFPHSLITTVETLEKKTQHATKLTVNFLFCYGARQEIIAGIKKLLKDIRNGIVTEDALEQDSFAHYLWTSETPEPDLILRTGGVMRLSNFLLYQAAYSELYFLDCLWPDITSEHLQKALDHFYACKRNFGS